MFITTLDSVTANGNKIQRVYEGKTEKLSVYYATNLWATYDRDHGERLESITTYDSEASYMISLTKDNSPLYLKENHRSLCTMHPNDELQHA